MHKRNLFNFLMESAVDIQSLKSYIATELEKIQDEDILAEIRSIILSHNMDPLAVQDYFEKRHLGGNCYKIITSKFNSFGDVDALQSLIEHGGSEITSEDFLHASNKDFYAIFNGICKDKTIESLYELNLPNENNIARGKLEVLLCTLLKDIKENGYGDVPTVMSGIIEIKGDGGMIKGQAAYDIGACMNKFNEVFSKANKEDDIFNGQKKLNALMKELLSQYTEEEVLKGIIECYLAKYPLKSISDSDLSVIRTQFQQYLSDNQSKIFNKLKVDSKIIWDAFLVTDFKFYQLLDKWDNLVVFNKKGKYCAFNAEKDIKTTYDAVLNNLKREGVSRISSAVKNQDVRYQAIKVTKK